MKPARWLLGYEVPLAAALRRASCGKQLASQAQLDGKVLRTEVGWTPEVHGKARGVVWRDEMKVVKIVPRALNGGHEKFELTWL